MATVAQLIEQSRGDLEPDACWPWAGNISAAGYGRRTVARGRQEKAHRLVYQQLVGPIPDELQLDHLCHTRDPVCPGGPSCQHRRCINPRHLEPVKQLENWSRGRSMSRQNLDRKACSNGHPFTPQNTYRHRGKGGRTYRRCRTCILDQNRRSAARQRAS